MTVPVGLYRTLAQSVGAGGTPVTVMSGPLAGGFVTNPQSAEDQGIPVIEALFIDLTGPAALEETATTYPIQPGQTFTIPAGMLGDVSVNAATSGHRFSAVVIQPPPPYPPAPQPSSFPPSGPTTLTDVIPAYLYEQYRDDDDVLAFFTAYNQLAQEFVSWFAGGYLPVYTSEQITGALLDWVALGLYGIQRPTLASGRNRTIGPLNTFGFNVLPYNARKTVGPTDVAATTDDVFKRIITWNFYKGDGNRFNVEWLKRRVMRFLFGPDGTAPNIDQTDIVSVTFGADYEVAIRISTGTRAIVGGALYNRFGLNTTAYNSLRTVFMPGPNPPPLAATLKEAVESGVLTLPFQYTFSVTI